MLVIDRREGQSLILGGGDSGLPRMKIRIIRIKKDGVIRIGIDAPREVPIHREEVANRIEQLEGELRPGVEGGTTLKFDSQSVNTKEPGQ